MGNDASRNVVCDYFNKDLPMKTPLTDYTIIKTFSGGKSGAIVMLVKHKEDSEYTNVLKIYPFSDRDAKGAIMVERTRRELDTICKMSGTHGFPVVFDFGKMIYNGTESFYVVMNQMTGIELGNLDLLTLTANDIRNVLVQILKLLFDAKKKLGDNFQHNDFHPGNLFVDSKKRITRPIQFDDAKTFFLRDSPEVSVIDFDMIQSKEYSKNLSSRKKTNGTLLPLSVYELIRKFVGLQNVDLILEYSYCGLAKEDIQIFNVYLTLFSVVEKFYREGNSLLQVETSELQTFLSSLSQCRNVNDCVQLPMLSQLNTIKTINEFVKQATESQRRCTINTLVAPGEFHALPDNLRKALARLDANYANKYQKHVQFSELAIQISSALANGSHQLTAGEYSIQWEIDPEETLDLLIDVAKKVTSMKFNKGLRLVNVLYTGTGWIVPTKIAALNAFLKVFALRLNGGTVDSQDAGKTIYTPTYTIMRFQRTSTVEQTKAPLDIEMIKEQYFNQISPLLLECLTLPDSVTIRVSGDTDISSEKASNVDIRKIIQTKNNQLIRFDYLYKIFQQSQLPKKKMHKKQNPN